MIEFSRKLSKEEQVIAQKVIQRNGFYAHPENVLKAMLCDEDEAVRERAVKKILEIREESQSSMTIGEKKQSQERESEEEEEEDEEEEEEGEEEEEQKENRDET